MRIFVRNTVGLMFLTSLAFLVSCANFEEKVAVAPVDCAQLAIKFVADGVRITATEMVPAGSTVPGMAQAYPMPAHCKVTGKMAERIGVDGKPYAIGFEMRLPEQWNQRFLFQANGGNDGVVVPAYGNVVASGATTNALMQGFAVLSSDAGHTMEPAATAGLVGGNLFGMDPQARLDYGYQANAKLAPMAKQLIGTRYGQPPSRSCMMGCSNGGRHGMVAAARDAQQFDGILVAAQVLEKCDALDGLKDGMVNNLVACQSAFDIKTLQCAGAKSESCLSAPQVTALQKVFAGPVTSKGEALYSDWPWDAGVGASQIGFGSWRAWKLQGPIAGLPIIGALGAGSMAYIFPTPPKPVAGNPPALIKSLLDFNFDTDAPAIFATQGAFTESSVQFMTPPNATDLSAFKQHGSKMIVYHGTSDPVFSFNDTRNWYEGVNKNQQGKAADLVQWVENGKVPDQIVATARPLCPYPKNVAYSGNGDINDASNFTCR